MAPRSPAVSREGLVLLQTACAQWMMAVLEFLDTFNEQRPVTGRFDPEGADSRVQAAVDQLSSAIKPCEDCPVGRQAKRLLDTASRLGLELARDDSPKKASMLIEAHRQLHIEYAELMIALGDELAKLSRSASLSA